MSETETPYMRFELPLATDNMREEGLPKMAANLQLTDGKFQAVDAQLEGLATQTTQAAQSASDAATLSAGAVEEAAAAKAVAAANGEAITNLGPLAQTTPALLIGDLFVDGPAWLIPDGTFSHTVTLAAVIPAWSVLMISDPERTLTDQPISLVSRTETANALDNATFSGGSVTLDYAVDGLHTVPEGWSVANPANVAPEGWSISIGEAPTVTFSATGDDGGLKQDAAYVADKPHLVSGRARKVSGDAAATLNVFAGGHAGGDLTPVIVAGVTDWVDFSVEVIPTGPDLDFKLLNRDGAAVWEIDHVTVSRFADIRLTPTLASDKVNMDGPGGLNLIWNPDAQEWQVL